MGRSVAYLRSATATAYTYHNGGYTAPWSDELDDYDYDAEPVFCYQQAEDDWRDLTDQIGEALNKFYPSFEFNPKGFGWDDREVLIIARNKVAIIGLAEYCGLVSLSIRPVEAEWYQDRKFNALGEKFASQVDLNKVLRYALGDEAVLRKVGTFSNGEAVFERARA